MNNNEQIEGLDLQPTYERSIKAKLNTTVPSKSVNNSNCDPEAAISGSMSTSAYYNFTTAATRNLPTAGSVSSSVVARKAPSDQAKEIPVVSGATTICLDESQRIQANGSPCCSSSMAASSSSSTSSCDSSSSTSSHTSLNQFNSLTAIPLTSPNSTASYSSSSAVSCASSSTSFNCASRASSHTAQLISPRNANSISPIANTMGGMSLSNTEDECHLLRPAFQASTPLQSLEPKPFKPFKSCDEYLEAMKEDLAEWLSSLYNDLELTADNLFQRLETGAIICRHANNVTEMGRSLMLDQTASSSINENEDLDVDYSATDNSMSLARESNNNTPHQRGYMPSPKDKHDGSLSPIHGTLKSNVSPGGSNTMRYQLQSLSRNRSNSSDSSLVSSSTRTTNQNLIRAGKIDWFQVKMIPFKLDACPGTFMARDNICQFIHWCRSLNILECLLFETDDLVARKNVKSFILCMLEVARIGFKVGMPTPLIIQLEQEIDREIENDAKLQKQLDIEEGQKNQVIQATIDTQAAARHGNDSDSEIDHIDDGCLIKSEEDMVRENEEITDEVKPNDAIKIEVEEELDLGPKPQVITNDLLSLHEKVSSMVNDFSQLDLDAWSGCNPELRHSFNILILLNFIIHRIHGILFHS